MGLRRLCRAGLKPASPYAVRIAAMPVAFGTVIRRFFYFCGVQMQEHEIIAAIEKCFPCRSEISPCGIGDDCAVLCDGLVLLTTDASVEGVHFDLSWMTAADAAYRCMTSNVSDVAAMGAFAGPFSLALGLPPGMSDDDILSVIEAFRRCIDDHGLRDCWLIGGDVVRSPVLMFSVTVLGKRPSWPMVYRSGACPGHRILALGHLGMSAAGLALCQRNMHGDGLPEYAPFLKTFRRPLALTQLGPALAREGLVSAMMDTSDGVRMDLPRLLAQSGCGAEIEISAFEPSAELLALGQTLGVDPRDWMVCGGEDFGLLMTAEAKYVKRIERLAHEHGVPCFDIGICTASRAVNWLEQGQQSLRMDQSFFHF